MAVIVLLALAVQGGLLPLLVLPIGAIYKSAQMAAERASHGA